MESIVSTSIGYAFLLTLIAGLSTGIGGAIAFFARRTNTKLLAVSLGFSAGVMIYVSFSEILSEAHHTLAEGYGDKAGAWYAVLAFFGGMLLIALIDKLVPSYENPHEIRSIEDMNKTDKLKDTHKLKRMGVLAALAIIIHNFPEGLATFTAALSDPSLGLAIAIAIAIHNIPEGIAVAVPFYYATGNRKKAFLLSFLSGLSEPVGAVIGFLILMPFMTPLVFGVIMAGVAGIMVFISLDELLPAAEEYGEHHLSIYGVVAGMAVMAVSLLLFV
ncbi:MAG: zinc transporter ZupT [Marinilabiliales bacterium]|nr:MAG: zinc transporter ZupT [Marinilabiliales bacterium]